MIEHGLHKRQLMDGRVEGRRQDRDERHEALELDYVDVSSMNNRA